MPANIDFALIERSLTLFSTGQFDSRQDALKAAIEERKKEQRKKQDKEIEKRQQEIDDWA